jgi:hypothetical protein
LFPLAPATGATGLLERCSSVELRRVRAGIAASHGRTKSSSMRGNGMVPNLG